MIHRPLTGPIGVFDSGYGGLTILRDVRRLLPGYDYMYLGDNARAPYGTRSFDVVYRFTLEAVKYLFGQGCPLVILACNTASAKALRTIQQCDLEKLDPTRRVLGVIRPTVEALGTHTLNGHIGILGTPGTINSRSYDIEIAKLWPEFTASTHACPMWVPLVENGEASSPGADYFVRQETSALFRTDRDIDTVVLACTHYPLLLDKIRENVPKSAKILTQGEIVASSLLGYLDRHPEMESRLTRNATTQFLTSEHPDKFSAAATIFLGHDISARHVEY